MARILLAFLTILPVWCTRVFAVPIPQKSPVHSAGVIYLGEEMERLKKMAAAMDVSDEQLASQNGNVFGKIPDKGTVNVGTFKPREWEKPEFVLHPQNDKQTGTVDGMMDAFEKTLATKEVPHPVLATMLQDYEMVRDLRQAGKVDYDKKGFLWKGTLGGYVYNAREAIGIFLHEDLRTVAKYLGDVFASLVLISHEGGHGTRDKESGLEPTHAVQDEIDAFNHQADALKAMDPKGHVISRLWELYVKGQDKNVPEEQRNLLSCVLQHFQRMKAARHADLESNTDEHMKRFVEESGYQDKPHFAFSGNGSHPS